MGYRLMGVTGPDPLITAGHTGFGFGGCLEVPHTHNDGISLNGHLSGTMPAPLGVRVREEPSKGRTAVGRPEDTRPWLAQSPSRGNDPAVIDSSRCPPLLVNLTDKHESPKLRSKFLVDELLLLRQRPES